MVDERPVQLGEPPPGVLVVSFDTVDQARRGREIVVGPTGICVVVGHGAE